MKYFLWDIEIRVNKKDYKYTFIYKDKVQLGFAAKMANTYVSRMYGNDPKFELISIKFVGQKKMDITDPYANAGAVGVFYS